MTVRSVKQGPGTLRQFHLPTALEPAKLDFGACKGNHALHVSKWEMPKALPLESNSSDHPRANTISLNNSETEEQLLKAHIPSVPY